MRLLRLFSWIGALSMSFVIIHALLNSSFFHDGGALLDNPWGVVSLVDLYVGFFLFSLWIFYREKSRNKALLWSILMMMFGFLTASVYLLILSYKEANIKTLLLGKHQI